MPDKELQVSDPLGYLEQMEQYRQDLHEFDKFKAEAEEQVKLNQKLAFEESQRYASEQAEILKKEMPELNDPEKSKKLLQDIQTIAVDYYQVPPEILGNLKHTWEFKIVRDAVAYRKLQTSKTKVVEKTKGARPMVKAGAKKTASSTKVMKQKEARSRMQKSGSLDDVTNYLLS